MVAVAGSIRSVLGDSEFDLRGGEVIGEREMVQKSSRLSNGNQLTKAGPFSQFADPAPDNYYWRLAHALCQELILDSPLYL